MAAGIGRQEMLTPPRHQIQPLVNPGVRVRAFISLICYSYLHFEIDYCVIFIAHFYMSFRNFPLSEKL
jgi:hypothetical protein